MPRDAHLQPRPISSPGPRRRAESVLLRTLDRAASLDDGRVREAVTRYVDALAEQALPPETTIVVFKETLGRSRFLRRYEPLQREELRTRLVTWCIERYFAAREGTDTAAQ
jgi:hypothetical protein